MFPKSYLLCRREIFVTFVHRWDVNIVQYSHVTEFAKTVAECVQNVPLTERI